MIGIVMVTHGRLAEELRHAVEHVVGRQTQFLTVCIGAEDDSRSRRRDVESAIDAVDAGDGVVLLTDMFGGTPSNLCISQMARSGVEVLAGVNLPMLVKLAKVRATASLRQATAVAQTSGRRYIAAASDVLSRTDGKGACMAGDGTSVAGPVQASSHPRAPMLATGMSERQEALLSTVQTT